MPQKTSNSQKKDRIRGAIPDDFNGTILDVYVGTAVFNEKKFGGQ